MSLHLTGTPEADRLLSDNPFALLVGMLLDQQIAMEVAFIGPHRLAERLGGELNPRLVAATDPAVLEMHFREKPALHRYPGSMAKRVHALAQHLVDNYDGDAAAVWNATSSGTEVKRNLMSLPGFGEQKAKIFTALLGKQCGIEPPGWRDAAGDYGLDGYRSIADISSPADVDKVRAFKQKQKAAKTSSGR